MYGHNVAILDDKLGITSGAVRRSGLTASPTGQIILQVA